ncbi:carbon-nitrogen hydrolase family protein [Kineococcus rhizosphaerae]|uniref:Putative amidohydrolase n=1 Tax=Kineococcus rhizosphaerae TaxID=559628 RepID=A0A2T0R6L1_9ACTN|nr:carbon-nitrogen hydrolase family protein [Kineococcus rhizosphaerae]PRY16798.1 putative amidohydrolase [Kineococcus rhizosphaerae]
MEIACLQTAGVSGDPGANLDALGRRAAEAAAGGASLLITPEMFLTGYDLGPDTPARVRALAPGLLDRVRALAREHSIALVVGLPEVVGDDCFNAAVLVGPDGRVLARHHKVHLFGDVDRAAFTAGDRLVTTADLDGLRIALLICYDVEFPEAVRAAALAGAHLVAVPTAQMHPFELVAEQVVRVRAWENQVHVAYVDRDGHEGSFDYVGRSSVVAPDGTVLASVEHGEALLFATVDPGAVERAQRANPYLADRRAALYGPLVG